jgi:hypothetical protein
MASAITTYPHQTGRKAERNLEPKKVFEHGAVSIFLDDLFEDLRQVPLAADTPEKHDLFREHINAMAICYFGLILLFIAGCLPVLAYLVRY